MQLDPLEEREGVQDEADAAESRVFVIVNGNGAVVIDTDTVAVQEFAL